jgi:hypothetical protein
MNAEVIMHHNDKVHSHSGAEGSGSDDSKIPCSPSKDDKTPLGDTDQHSKADHNVDIPSKAVQEAEE